MLATLLCFIVFAIIMYAVSQNFVLLCIFIGVCALIATFAIYMVFTTLLEGEGSHTPPPTPPKERHTQTEDEFNEMAITTLYANQWLDDND